MKNIFLTLLIYSTLISCNINPNKEERIQNLENQIQLSLEKINELEKKLLDVENTNKDLLLRISEIEAK